MSLHVTWEFRPLESGSGPWLLPEAEPSAFQEDLIGLVMNMYPVRRACHQEPALLHPAALLCLLLVTEDLQITACLIIRELYLRGYSGPFMP